MFGSEDITLEERKKAFLFSQRVVVGIGIEPSGLSWNMGSITFVFVESSWFVRSFAIVRDCRKNFITDAIVDHGMSCLHTKIMGMLHDGIDLLIIDRPNKVDSRREGLQGNREKSWRELTAIVSRVSVVELLKMGCCFMCASTIAKKIPDKINVLETCLERTRSRLASVAVVVVGLGRSLGTSIMVAGRSSVAIVVLVTIALVVVIAMVMVTSPSTAETSPSSVKTMTMGLVSTLKPWRTSIILTTMVVLVVVVSRWR
jgi:hypothetical protein